MKKRNPLWFYFVLFLLPILILVFFELSLRLFNYSPPVDDWISVSKEKMILNPEIAKKYFQQSENIPFATEAILNKYKLPNTLRIIVLGGSSAAGYPYMSSGSFSKYLRKALKLQYPSKNIEVANFSMSAINSYTLDDFMDIALEVNPDIILIYAGHNEYYGALGAASAATSNYGFFLTKVKLFMDEFRITKLVSNVIKSFSDDPKKERDGTLMSKMAEENFVPYKSDLFYKGLEQFESNLNSMFQKSYKVPIIIGNLISNYRDQKPFVSVEFEEFDKAETIFKKANDENLSLHERDSLYRLAKDLDALRFRAPSDFNKLIKELSGKNGNVHFIDLDKMISKKAEHGIIGNDLMTDHLHPNLRGYKLMGIEYLKKIVGILDGDIDYKELASIDEKVGSNYVFTELDSVIAEMRIKLLKNDWPYISPDEKVPENEIIKFDGMISKTAYKVLKNRISRKEAREVVADFYMKKKNNLDLFLKEYFALKEEFPFAVVQLNNYAATFIKNRKYSDAEKILQADYRLSPDAFSTKWLGNINLFNKNLKQAVKFLNESLKFERRDPQVYFNLAGAYSDLHQYNKAFVSIQKCLEIAPNYKGARKLAYQLGELVK